MSMKNYYGMRKPNTQKYILTKPSRVSDLTFDDLFGDDDSYWEEKSSRLQTRRWRKIKHQLV